MPRSRDAKNLLENYKDAQGGTPLQETILYLVTFSRLLEQIVVRNCVMADRIKMLSVQFMAQRHALLGFIYGMVRDSAAAEDILQEVWLRLADAAERNEPIVQPGSWCRGVAKNLILHFWRDRQSAKVLVDSELLDLVDRGIEEAEDHWAERRHALMECVDLLPRNSKRVLTLKYDRGMTFAAMADLLNRSVDSLKMAISRLRQALLECAERKLRTAEQKP